VTLTKLLSETTPDGVLVLTMNDPATRNAADDILQAELVSEVKRFAGDRELRVLLITGAGTAFSSGADVRSFVQSIDAREHTRAAATDRRPSPWEMLDPVYTENQVPQDSPAPEIVPLLFNLQKPSIAAVNGPAYGIGCGIALLCDFRIAGESATFCEAFIRNGLVTGDGSAWLLPKLIGMSNTLWMQYTGEPVAAHEALRIGLVNALAADDALMNESLQLATKLARGPVFAMGLIKQLVHRGYEQNLNEALQVGFRAQALARDTSDHEEGARAFIEKRPPRFRGR
jgi:enoyl-CoA hydratase/carnithine racemase